MNKKKTKIRLVAVLVILLISTTLVHYVSFAEGTMSQTYYIHNSRDFENALSVYQDGDIFVIDESFSINNAVLIGSEYKHLTIKRGDGKAFIVVNTTSNFTNVTFDGVGYASEYPFVDLKNNASFKNCIFQGCGNVSKYLSANNFGGAVRVGVGTSNFINCIFTDNCALVGGHIMVNDGMAELTGCTLQNGYANSRGGAIYVNQGFGQCIVSLCTITGNHAGDVGGGIANYQSTTIKTSKIYNNSAGNGGADICNAIGSVFTMVDTINELTVLFKPDNIKPIEWVNDYIGVYIPDVDETQENSLMKLVYTIIEEPTTEPSNKPTDAPTEEPTDDSGKDNLDEQEKENSEQNTDAEDESGALSNEDKTSGDSTTTTNTNNSINSTDSSTTTTNTDNSTTTNTDNSTTITNGDSSTSTNTDSSTTTIDNSITNTDSSVTNTDSSSKTTMENSGNTSNSMSGNVDSSTATTNTDNSLRSSTDSRDQSMVNNYDYSSQNNHVSNVWNGERNASIQTADQKSVENQTILKQNTEKELLSGTSGQGENIISDPSNNIRIDAKQSDVVFEVKDGSYSICIEESQHEQGTEQMKESSVVDHGTDDWYEMIKIFLLAAIGVILIRKPRTR